jgi:hypothetical protein
MQRVKLCDGGKEDVVKMSKTVGADERPGRGFVSVAGWAEL